MNAEREGRVRAFLTAARRAMEERSYVEELSRTTGLSREGVRLAIDRALELDATDEEIRALVSRSEPSGSVHVILSANVFTAPLRAIAFALAVAPDVTVRASRRDPILARAFVSSASDAGLRLSTTEQRDVSRIDARQIHVYGRDETVDRIRRSVRAGVRVLAHGAGMGVAYVSRSDARNVDALATDVVMFDQAGCLSPRVAFVEGGSGAADTFGERLHDRLETFGREIPRGSLDLTVATAIRLYVETMTFSGAAQQGVGHVVGVATRGSSLVLPPGGRVVHVVPVIDADEACALLRPFASLVVGLGTDDAERAAPLVALTPRARVLPLGLMQRPPFDGPVDLR